MYGYKDLSIDVRASLVRSAHPFTLSQLRFASGSLVQYLNVSYSEKLPSSSAVDEVESTLAKFIPESYYTDEKKFLERVEHDAINFKPVGEKIHSYTRAATTLPKGKNVAIPQILSPEDEEIVDFEVYHVSIIPLLSGGGASWSAPPTVLELDGPVGEASSGRPSPSGVVGPTCIFRAVEWHGLNVSRGPRQASGHRHVRGPGPPFLSHHLAG